MPKADVCYKKMTLFSATIKVNKRKSANPKHYY